MQASKETILNALAAFVAQRPGFEPGNYATAADLRADQRRATRQRHDAEAMIGWIRWHNIDADALRIALSRGRLTWTEDGQGGGTLDYCTGQYWCTEFRAGVCRALSSAIWDYLRDSRADMADGDTIRAAARHEFGLNIARRWFE